MRQVNKEKQSYWSKIQISITVYLIILPTKGQLEQKQAEMWVFRRLHHSTGSLFGVIFLLSCSGLFLLWTVAPLKELNAAGLNWNVAFNLWFQFKQLA